MAVEHAWPDLTLRRLTGAAFWSIAPLIAADRVGRMAESPSAHPGGYGVDRPVGFNTGVDVSYPLSSRIGVGGLIRYSSADVKFDDPNTGHHTVKAGGLEAAAGVRLKF